MMQSFEKEIVPRRELRQFGLGLCVLLGLVGSALLLNGHRFGYVLLFSGLLLSVAFWCDWPGMRIFYALWMKLAGGVACVMTTLLLTLMYLLVLTPVALLGRAFGKRFVERGFCKEQVTYWGGCKKSSSRQSCEKQS